VRWKLKAGVQKAVAALPFGSNAAYYAIQRTVGGLRRGLNHPMERFRAAIRAVEWIESANATINGKRVVEIGTGHMVNMPTAFWLMGAEETLTVDLNRYLSYALVKESNEFIRRNEASVLALFGARSSERIFQERFQKLLSFDGQIEGLLKLMSVRYVAPGDARRLPVGDATLDYHVSNTVLEHIPREVLEEILAEARRVLTPEGLLIHHIDPSDHFSHDDSSIVAVNFLKYSDDEWQRLAGNQFMYHNRLRAADFVSIFEGAGVRILRMEKRIDEPSLAALRNGFSVSERFSGVDSEELAVTELSIMGHFGT
jgi:SAM-dependent methyltransferase